MTHSVRYGGQDAVPTSGDGAKGVLLRTLDGSWVFRVYGKHAASFVDHRVNLDELSVTIEPHSQVGFYELADGTSVLDHSPEVLGLSSSSSQDA